MPEATPTERVRILEQNVADLASLPDPVTAIEGQIVHLREEMHDGFAAIRQEMRSEVGGLRGEVAELRGEVAGLRGEVGDLRGEIRSGDEETRRFMRVLHDEVIARVAAIGEGGRGRR